jgi:hypothetical protein
MDQFRGETNERCRSLRIHRQALLAVNAAKTRRDNYRKRFLTINRSKARAIRSALTRLTQEFSKPTLLPSRRSSRGLKERLHSAQIALAQKQSRLDEAKQQASKLSQLNTLLTSPGEDVSYLQIQALESQEQRALESLNQANTLQIRKAALE